MSGNSADPHESRNGTAAVGNEDPDGAHFSRELREGEQNLRLQMIEGLRDCAIFMLDRSGRVATWNAGAERFKGYKAAEIIGKDFSCFHSAEDIATSKPQRELLVAEREGRLEDEGWRLRKDGSRFWANVVITSLRDPNGQLIGFGKVTQDIAERRKATEQFRLAIEAAPTGMLMMDRAGRIVLVNTQVERLFGYPRDELLGQGIEMLVPERLRERHPDFRKSFFGDPKARAMGSGRDLYGLRKDGTEVPVEIGLNPLKTSEGDFVLSSVVDITERRRAEIDLSRQSQELQAINRQLHAANAELQAFADSLSHELRAPLRHVHGYIELLTGECAVSQLSDKARRHLQTITEASTEMAQLIDGLLTFARMSQIELQESQVDLDGLVQDAIRALERETQGRNIDWKIAPLPHVFGDPTALKQVFANLIGNAVKYSSPRNPAQIEIGCAGEEDGRAILFVRDNGVGFDTQYAHKLFRVFQRLHRDTQFEGTGVGLAIVQRLVVRHGGRAWAEGTLNEGATVYFTLLRATAG